MASLGEQALRRSGVSFTSHEYDFRKKGAEIAAAALDLPLSATLKSLVVKLAQSGPEGESPDFVFVLVPGGSSVSMRSLARALGAKAAELASERDTERLTGYRIGGISPFGSRTPLQVYVDLSALDHDRVYVNGGRRGLLLGLDPEALIEAAKAEIVDVGIKV